MEGASYPSSCRLALDTVGDSPVREVVCVMVCSRTTPNSEWVKGFEIGMRRNSAT